VNLYKYKVFKISQHRAGLLTSMMKEENVPNQTLFPDVTNTTSIVACDDPPHEELVGHKSGNNDDTL
jgi:hypothetical protein